MAGPIEPADCTVDTTGLCRVLHYEPCDLTISVEAGMPWRELSRTVAQNNQILPLDPPFSDAATVGGVVAANTSGPRRRLYGTVRDMVIGMTFATLEGKLIQSGGMVVKNVAGLDTAKLLIGSFGTLAAIAVVNFKLAPAPELERSFVLEFESPAAAFAARNRILESALQPVALDLIRRLGAESSAGEPLPSAVEEALASYGWLLVVRAAGTTAALDRYTAELAELGRLSCFEAAGHEALWRRIENQTTRFLSAHPLGAILRVSATLKGLEQIVPSLDGPIVARAGSGVLYGYFEVYEEAAGWLAEAHRKGWKAVLEFGPGELKRGADLWPDAGSDLGLMRQLKNMFDPLNLLNRGRLYGRI
jgi:glycolate oxidase FAD binding subunit